MTSWSLANGKGQNSRGVLLLVQQLGAQARDLRLHICIAAHHTL